MSKISIKIFLSLCFFLFLFSCTVHKRIHRPGYFVQWNKNYKSQSKESKEDKQLEIALNEIETEDNIIPSSITINGLNEETSLYLNDEVESSLIKQHYVIEEKCDIIFFKDGKEVEAKVIEVNEENIKYIPCNSSSPTYTVNTSKIFMIKYATGTKEMFDVQEKKIESHSPTYSYTEDRSNDVDVAGIVGLIFGVVSLIAIYFSFIIGCIIGLIALILGIVSLSRNNKSKALGVLSLIFGLLSIIGSTFFIIAAL